MNTQKTMKDQLITIIEQKCPMTGITINQYSKGKRLGKGGFATCYEVINIKNNQKYAAKIIDKTTLTKAKAKQKLASQIKIHSQIKSSYVVKYQHFFQDSQFVYIILELCENQTLNQLIKRRKRLTQLQAKYYMYQLIVAIKDIHEQGVIHRDLKLGNLLLTDKLQIRVGDFGLAAKVTSKCQKRKTMCGTPNYIAPEILDNINGHSFQVDIWSLGVIAYALIVGRPPFQTNDVKTTYAKIKNCNYGYPQGVYVTDLAKSFISKMLQRDPRHRATVQQILNDQFFTLASFPTTLPMSTLACPPNANFVKQYTQQNNSQVIQLKKSTSEYAQTDSGQSGLITDRGLSRVNSRRNMVRASSSQKLQNNQVKRAASTAALIKNQPIFTKVQPKQINKNKYGPYVWVIYHQQNPKFGMSYMLNSNSIGMRYNDSTNLISNSDFKKFKYFDSVAYKQNPNMRQQIYEIQSIPQQMSKKFKIIDYYRKQLKIKKQQDQSKMCNQQVIQKQKLRFRQSLQTMLQIFVVKYYKNSNVTIFWFNNKDCQLIFKDSTELLLSRNHITYVNKVGNRKYFQKEDLEKESQEIKKRMKYATTVMETIKQSYNNNGNKQQPVSNVNQQINKQNKSSSNNLTATTVELKKKLTRSSSIQKMEKIQTLMNKNSGLGQQGMMKVSASMNRLAAYNKYLER